MCQSTFQAVIKMAKYNLIVYSLIAIVIVLIIANVYLLNSNLSITSQKESLATKQEMSNLLTQVKTALDSELEQVDLDIQSACQQLSTVNFGSSQVRAILSALVDNNSFIKSASLEVDGILVVVEPEERSYIEGSDVTNQEQTIRLRQTLRPVMSNQIKLVENIYGVVMAAPIFNNDKTFVGAVTIVIEPNQLINQTITSIYNGADYTFMGIQVDGLVLYDVDQAQIGTETLSNPVFQGFPDLLATCQRMATEKAGYSTYEFKPSLASSDVISKELFWVTIEIYGTEWRLAIIHALS